MPTHPVILPRPEHPISRRDLSEGALKVLYRLKRSGYVAYLVGGAVRDLLLGRKPKDFDVATNATPREVRALFHNSRIIGRRFRLVQVLFRNEIVEVSTFQKTPVGPDREKLEPGEEPEPEPTGTPLEDALRRDFTVNALFYNIADFSIIDYVGGLEDIKAGVIRSIGDPTKRFAEDPVRMMRALEYAARLGFKLDPSTAAAIAKCKSLINEAAPARLTYELVEGLRSGNSRKIFRLFHQTGLLHEIHPEAASQFHELERVLSRLDAKVSAGIQPQEVFLIALTLLPSALVLIRRHLAAGKRRDRQALVDQLGLLASSFGERMHLPARMIHLLHQGLFALVKLARPPASGRQVARMTRLDYFPLALWLLEFWSHKLGGPREAYDKWAAAAARAEVVQDGGA